MNRMWEIIAGSRFSDYARIRIFLLCNCIMFCLLGFIVWLLVRGFCLNSFDWALCFIGFPGVFLGFFGGLIFLGRRNS